MKYLIVIILSTLSLNALASHSEACREYSPNQMLALEDAYNAGKHVGYGFTMAAITQQESFISKSVIRIRPNDVSSRYVNQSVVPMGAYGTTHMLLSTAMELEGMDPTNPSDVLYGLEFMIPRIMFDTHYSMMYTLQKLEESRRYNFGPEGYPNTSEDWVTLWGGYNSYKHGRSYGLKIRDIVREFQRCATFDHINSEF